LIFCCATVSSCVIYQSQPISPHEGDGVFEDLSGWIGPIRDSGYQIKFPEFDLSHPFEAQYRVSRLPNLGFSIYIRSGIYLVLMDVHNDSIDEKKIGGWFSLEFLKSDGTLVCKSEGALGDYSWWGFGNKRALYWFDPHDPKNNDQFYLYFHRNETYIIKISYGPPPECFGKRGYVYISAGAKYSGARRR